MIQFIIFFDIEALQYKAVRNFFPLADVFWYKEEAKDIEQIEESDRVDINYSNGQHSLEIYNTTKEDEGRSSQFQSCHIIR